jgi:hypothetical protein
LLVFIVRGFRAFRGSNNKPVNSGFWMGSKIDKQADPHACCFQIIQNLSLVLWGDLFGSLDLNDHRVKADEIGSKSLQDWFPTIFQADFTLGTVRDTAAKEFTLQTFFINGLKESTAQFTVNIEDGTLDFETFFSE